MEGRTSHHYATARRMLGVARNPRLFKADEVRKQIAEELSHGNSFESLPVGVFFRKEDETIPESAMEKTIRELKYCPVK